LPRSKKVVLISGRQLHFGLQRKIYRTLHTIGKPILRQELPLGEQDGIAESFEIAVEGVLELAMAAGWKRDWQWRPIQAWLHINALVDCDANLARTIQKDIGDQRSDIQVIEKSISQRKRNHVGLEINVPRPNLGRCIKRLDGIKTEIADRTH